MGATKPRLRSISVVQGRTKSRDRAVKAKNIGPYRIVSYRILGKRPEENVTDRPTKQFGVEAGPNPYPHPHPQSPCDRNPAWRPRSQGLQYCGKQKREGHHIAERREQGRLRNKFRHKKRSGGEMQTKCKQKKGVHRGKQQPKLGTMQITRTCTQPTAHK